MQINAALMLTLLLLLLLSPAALQAAVVPHELDETSNAIGMDTKEIGYLELKPNGTLILEHPQNQSGGDLQNFLLLRSVLQALKLHSSQEQVKLNIKMYGDGVEHKFPPLLERIIQRIQTFFSIYRHTDTSHPVRKDEVTTVAPPIVASTVKAKTKPTKTTTTTKRTTTTTTTTTTILPRKDVWITVGEDK
ncbi:hypothetical protein AWZ03_000791 [Drosophila navojoa]|uniref:Uncharacterized protein n=1 Tax=Drosophila navojoa TaxID=7232 RepID=A0A484BUU7_DRONA|nr:uncharacterized protein LOC108650194 [Drosophila navojoa]TDG52558.1 hypothetical protein AWZ03_000791 [Drosophila navojoa]